MNPRKGSRKRGYRGWKLRSEDKGWMTIRGKIWRLKAEAHVPSRRILVSEIPPMVLVGRAASEEGEAGDSWVSVGKPLLAASHPLHMGFQVIVTWLSS